MTWLGLITALTILEFIVAQVIPFFDDLLSVISSLFISSFTFYFPAIMWYVYSQQRLLSRNNETSHRGKHLYHVYWPNCPSRRDMLEHCRHRKFD